MSALNYAVAFDSRKLRVRGTTNRSSESQMSERQLLLSKAMLMRGEGVLRSSGVFDAGVALLLLQDAVEMALHAVATKLGARPTRKASFEDYWGMIDAAGGQLGQLPMKIDMSRMNSARVDLKHHANHPDRNGVEEHFRNARGFLGKITAQYFSPLDFERLSIVSLVTDEEIRTHLEAAEGHRKNDDLRAALISSAHAYRLIREGQERIFLMSHLVIPGVPAGVDPAIIKQIKDEVAHLRSLIRELATLTLGRAFGLNLIDLQLLQRHLPTIRGTEIAFSPMIEEHVTAQTVERCIFLLANYAIHLIEELGALNNPEWGVTSLL